MNSSFLLIILATVASIATYARRLPLQNITMFSALMFLVGLALEAMAEKISIPFAPVRATQELHNPFIANAMLWVLFLLNSRPLALCMMNSRRKASLYGIYVLVLTSLLVAGSWCFLDRSLSLAKIAWHFVIRFGCSVAILLICFPWFLDKRRNYDDTNE